VVPLLLVAFSLTAVLTSPERVRQLGDRLADLLPPELGAPGALRTLAEAGTGLDLLGFVLALSRCPSTATACAGRCSASPRGRTG
jgi:membrane protein